MDASIFPSLTADPLQFNTQNLLTGLANATLEDPETYNPVVYYNPVDLNSQIQDPSVFNTAGDPRFTLGTLLSSAYAEFLPRIQAYQEVADAGGCQVINEYICDIDGNPLAVASSNCAGISNIGIIDPQEVISFVDTQYSAAVQNHADKFVTYLQTNFISQGWTLVLVSIPALFIFYVKATKTGQTTVFIKYYVDQLGYVAQKLGMIPVIKLATDTWESTTDAPALMNSFIAGPPF